MFCAHIDEWKLAGYFRQWNHVRDLMISRYFMSTPAQPATPLRADVWQQLLSFGFSSSDWESKVGDTKRQARRQEARDLVKGLVLRRGQQWEESRLIAPYFEDPLSAPPPEGKEGRRVVWELCEISFRFELLALDAKLNKRRPRAGEDTHDPRFGQDRRLVIAGCFDGGEEGDVFLLVSKCKARAGLALRNWNVRARYLRALWKVMDSWDSSKPHTWDHLDRYSMDEEQGREFERNLVANYCQTFYDTFGRPPILPRTLALEDTNVLLSR